jgi:hypothetical protein
MDSRTEVTARRDIPRASEVTLNLARANGEFYNALITTYLSRGDVRAAEQQARAGLVLLPGPIRPLYEKGLQGFNAELSSNHALFEQNRGAEVGYALRCVMESNKSPQEQITRVLSTITGDKARFIEPVPGVAIIQVDHEIYYYLQQEKLVPVGAHAVHFGSDNSGEPSFMIVQRLNLEKGLDHQDQSPQDNVSARHEFHHFIWNFLQRAKFIRGVKEETPEMSKAFSFFRNELCAYIVENRPLTQINPSDMVYTQDQAIQAKALDAKSLSYVCLELAKVKGIDPATFLYPAMTSRSFDELKKKFLELTPLDGQIDAVSLDTLFSLWKNKNIEQNVLEVFKLKNAQISPEVMNTVVDQRMDPATWRIRGDIQPLRNFRYAAQDLERFNEMFGVQGISAGELLEKVLGERLPLPSDVIKEILAMPEKISDGLPVIKDPKEFILKYVSIWRINDEEQRDVYSLIINATPQLRAVFEEVKTQIIEQDQRSIRQEFGYERADETAKNEIDRDIQERTKLFSHLS